MRGLQQFSILVLLNRAATNIAFQASSSSHRGIALRTTKPVIDRDVVRCSEFTILHVANGAIGDDDLIEPSLVLPVEKSESIDKNSVFTPSGSLITPAPRKSVESDQLFLLRFRTTTADLLQSAVIGMISGFAVGTFKLSIEAVRRLFYEREFLAHEPFILAAIPACGGLAVGLLLLLGAFPPGLRATVIEVDYDSRSPVANLATQLRAKFDFLRKSAAAVFTLGTGCSLGPEGPCVELGMSVARTCMNMNQRGVTSTTTWNRLLLSCGAAAGVAAGFNAPIAGVFFALEVMQNAFSSVQQEYKASGQIEEESSVGMFSSAVSITPVLLSSVISALVSRTILGNHLVLTLTEYSLKTPLVELPLYLILGALSGGVAFSFSRLANWSQKFFAGELGNDAIKSIMGSIPSSAKPVIGGLLCGFVGLQFPQILFFGYETLNSLLANSTLPTTLLLSLLLVKLIMTAISAGSGLVGGTFAPSLFLGAMTGASFHNCVSNLFQFAMSSGVLKSIGGPVLELADVPAYAMVGAACVLAALFRAPLTASLLLFELTRDYDVILPLMASAGVGSVVCDILDEKLKLGELTYNINKRRKQGKRRDEDGISWGDLADKETE